MRELLLGKVITKCGSFHVISVENNSETDFLSKIIKKSFIAVEGSRVTFVVEFCFTRLTERLIGAGSMWAKRHSPNLTSL